MVDAACTTWPFLNEGSDNLARRASESSSVTDAGLSRNRPISDIHKTVIYVDKKPAGEHMRRFITPTIDEVTIVVVDDQALPRDIVLHRRNDRLTKVAETHDALQYPIIFWDATDGYHFNVKMINEETNMRRNVMNNNT
uniref:Uncharacterized protein n=1 Tax=Loa loa TaxID=7209 RepID=A0A1I7VNM2_LOALO